MQSAITKLPIEIQLLIDEYYNEYREYYRRNVLPNIHFTNRILKYYNRTDEFIYLKITNNRKKHFLININKMMEILKNGDGGINIINEHELVYTKILNGVKVNRNNWIRINLTSMIQPNGGHPNTFIETLYINKYNYNQFAIKITSLNLNGGNNFDIYVVEPIAHIKLLNYCNYYSAFNFHHLPENAVALLQ
jgi:hypothetical protein